jgi:alkylation response protein AidB-like acyl-CoA dehydrogenase
MDFDLSSEQKMLQASLSGLLSNAVDPARLVQLGTAEMDALRAKLDKALFEMGLAGILVDERNGGHDLGLLTLAAVAEELGRNAAPSSIVRNALAAWTISQAGNDAQKQRYLPGLLDGSLRAAFAVQDEQGWSPEGWTSPATGAPVRKRNVEGALDAHILIVGLAGPGLGVALRDAVAIADARPPLDATRPVADLTAPLDAIVPLEASSSVISRLRDAHLAVLAADAYGAGQRALDMSVEYSKTRSQFDRLIGSFQGLKHQLANMAVEMHPARYLAWYAAHAWDAVPDDVEHASALAKAHVPDVAVRTSRATVELHGGIGYTWEYPLHLFLKRAMFDRVAWGGVEEHRARAATLAAW